MFSVSKLVHVVAFFLQKGGGSMSKLKLMKLLYLSERESLLLFGFGIVSDKLCSLPSGPALVGTAELLSGSFASDELDGWIKHSGDHVVELKKSNVSVNDLDELSLSDLEILEKVWENCGKMDKWQIRDYVCHHCPEWSGDSVVPITFEELFLACGMNKDEACVVANEIKEEEYRHRMFNENCVLGGRK